MTNRNRVSPRAPAPSSLALACNKALGFSLVEVMLSMGVVSIMAAGGFALYSNAQNNAHIRAEQDHIQEIVRKADAAYGATGGFSTLTPERAIVDNVAPQDMVSGITLRSSWGQDVDLSPVTIGTKSDAGMQITYSNVPSRSCARLATSVADGMWDIRINGVSVLDDGELVIADLTSRCAMGDTAQMVFTYYGGASGLAITTPTGLCSADPSNPLCALPPSPVAPPTSLPPTPPWSTPLPPPPPPAGPPPPAAPPTGSPTPPSPGTPPGAPPFISAPPPQMPPAFCPPVAATQPSVAPRDCTAYIGAFPGSDTVCEDGSAATSTQPFNCPAGQLISTPGSYQYQSSGTQTRTRNEDHAYACTDPWNANPLSFADRWTASSWNGWFPSLSCAPTCTAPPPDSVDTPEARTGNCPAGQVTSSGLSTFSQGRVRTDQTDYTCSTPVGPVAVAGTTTFYSPWSPSVASVCAPACVAPAPTSTAITRAAPPETQSLACPSGQTGTWTQSRSRVENGTRTTNYSCPAPQGSATFTSTDTWSGTYTATSPWADTTNTCAPPPAPGCTVPSGSTNGVWQNDGMGSLDPFGGAPGNYLSNIGDAARRSNCLSPSRTGLAYGDGAYGSTYCYSQLTSDVDATNAQSAITLPSCACIPGELIAIRSHPTASSGPTEFYSCVAAPPPPVCGPAPATATQTLACPAGQTGSITQTHDWSSAPSPTCWTASPWATTSDTCTPSAPPPVVCVMPSPAQRLCGPGSAGTLCTDGAKGSDQRTVSQNVPCPAGQYVTDAGSYFHHSFGVQKQNQERQRLEAANCTDPYSPAEWCATSWQPWYAVTTWSPASFNCAVGCEAAATFSSTESFPGKGGPRTVVNTGNNSYSVSYNSGSLAGSFSQAPAATGSLTWTVNYAGSSKSSTWTCTAPAVSGMTSSCSKTATTTVGTFSVPITIDISVSCTPTSCSSTYSATINITGAAPVCP